VSTDEKTRKALKNLGLTGNEARAYLSIVEFGPLSANEISGSSNIPYSKIHNVLSSLEEKGWLTVESGRPNRYMARPPAEALEVSRLLLLNQRKGHEDQVIGELTPLYEKRSDKEKPDIWIIRGEFNILKKIREVLNKARREIMITLPVVSSDIIQLLHVVLLRFQGAGAVIMIMASNEVSKDDLKQFSNFAQVRVREKMYGGGVIVDEHDTILLIGDEKEPKNIFAIWSDHIGLTKLAKDYFQYLWNSSETLEK
jgi:HTH-type transcriptional regulator, sugar sensing transcriptional regulator